MLIIWLQGIWLPLHGYNFEDTPLWAGIYLLPLTIGFVAAGPVSGYLSDRYGAKVFATGGLVGMAATFIGLLLIPVNFRYPVFAVLLFINGVGSGLFSAPNTTAVMNAVPAGLSNSLPGALHAGLAAQGVPGSAVAAVAAVPPVGLMFAAFLGSNPIASRLSSAGVLHRLPAHTVETLTSKKFFPGLLSGPFHEGLVVVFTLAAVLAAVGAVVSLFRGGIYIHDEE